MLKTEVNFNLLRKIYVSTMADDLNLKHECDFCSTKGTIAPFGVCAACMHHCLPSHLVPTDQVTASSKVYITTKYENEAPFMGGVLTCAIETVRAFRRWKDADAFCIHQNSVVHGQLRTFLLHCDGCQAVPGSDPGFKIEGAKPRMAFIIFYGSSIGDSSGALRCHATQTAAYKSLAQIESIVSKDGKVAWYERVMIDGQ